MKTRSRHTIARQFFDATEQDDAAFLQSLSTLLRTGQRPPSNEPDQPDILRQLSDSVSEEAPEYAPAPLDSATCTVGEALKQFLDSEKLSTREASKKLGISPEQMEALIAEMMPLTSATVPSVAQFFGTAYNLKPLTLRQWLITGLRYHEMEQTEHGPTRIAARKKKP
ncbi:MAG: helix-turn-helix transcriptional regulator [Bacteroidetes bacterium]|nr:helix-turn-helix transcriptional regulator [Bacteroidota bacterium]MCW5896734.1 helix-turn-helix transcriptional regulator [Bacteroidota bacterium]